jgi:hypothetical protein
MREIAPLPARFLMTPEWHRAFAHLLRLSDDPKTRALGRAFGYTAEQE